MLLNQDQGQIDQRKNHQRDRRGDLGQGPDPKPQGKRQHHARNQNGGNQRRTGCRMDPGKEARKHPLFPQTVENQHRQSKDPPQAGLAVRRRRPGGALDA